MLNVLDWNSWLASSETREALRILKQTAEELKEVVSSGSQIQEKSIEKISLDYTYTLGQIEGIMVSIDTIKDISSLAEESDGNQ